jgi:uncharacterized protein YqiB (DUF1249 family)
LQGRVYYRKRMTGKVSRALQGELNAFLGVWLRNLRAQGHRLVPERD